MTKGDETAVGPKPFPNQLTPDMKYRLSISGVHNKDKSWAWAIYVTGPASASEVPGATPSTNFPLDTEIWRIDQQFLNKLQKAVVEQTSITITPLGNEIPPSSTSTKVEMPALSLWTQLSTPPTIPLFLGNNNDGIQVGIDFALTKNTPWQGTVTWYVGMQGGNPPPQSVIGNNNNDNNNQPITLTYNTVSSSAGVTWYMMTQTPLSWIPYPGPVPDSDALGVALAPANNQLYLAFTSPSDNTVYYSTSSDGVSWSSPTSIGASAEGGPALASLDDTLYLVYRTSDQNNSSAVYMCTSTNAGTGWSQSTDTGASASSAPALAVFSAESTSTSVLCMAYLDTQDSCMHVRTWDGAQWSDKGGPSVSAAGAPALVGYNNQLLLAQQGATSQTIEIYATSGGQTSPESWSWSTTAILWVDSSRPTVTSDPSAQKPESPLVLSNPSFCVYLGRLFLAFTDADQNVWICSSDDGQNWSGFAQLPEQIGGSESSVNPALATFTPSSGPNSGVATLALAMVTQGCISVLTAT